MSQLFGHDLSTRGASCIVLLVMAIARLHTRTQLREVNARTVTTFIEMGCKHTDARTEVKITSIRKYH